MLIIGIDVGAIPSAPLPHAGRSQAKCFCDADNVGATIYIFQREIIESDSWRAWEWGMKRHLHQTFVVNVMATYAEA